MARENKLNPETWTEVEDMWGPCKECLEGAWECQDLHWYKISTYGEDTKVIQSAVNQGIDSYLDGFTEASFRWHCHDNGRLDTWYTLHGMALLLRRLGEVVLRDTNEEKVERAEMLALSILDSLGINY